MVKLLTGATKANGTKNPGIANHATRGSIRVKEITIMVQDMRPENDELYHSAAPKFLSSSFFFCQQQNPKSPVLSPEVYCC